VTVVVLSSDLLIASRILSQAEAAGVPARTADHPGDLPPPGEVDLLLVNWMERDAGWGTLLNEWCGETSSSARPRIILFGPHTDLEAHTAAREAGLGPMLGRSKLIADLPAVLRNSLRGRDRSA
jgi:hypothetical protein